jgi:hypothetical protein
MIVTLSSDVAGSQQITFDISDERCDGTVSASSTQCHTFSLEKEVSWDVIRDVESESRDGH